MIESFRELADVLQTYGGWAVCVVLYFILQQQRKAAAAELRMLSDRHREDRAEDANKRNELWKTVNEDRLHVREALLMVNATMASLKDSLLSLQRGRSL